MSTIAFPIKRADSNTQAQPSLDLPEPRIWTPEKLAGFLSVSKSWIYKRCESKAEDPIPRVPGIGRLRFDTWHPDFQAWIGRQLGYVDRSEHDA